MILEGTTSSGAVVPVQVTDDGKVVAEGRTGPEGPQGPEGPEGPQGPEGPAGAPGNLWSGSDPGPISYTGGSVGIGTTPDSAFHLRGASAKFEADSNSAQFFITPDATPSGGVNLNVSYGGSGSYGPLNFSTGGSTSATIDSSGRLLVGTSSNRNNSEIQLEKVGSTTLALTRNSNDDNGPTLYLASTRGTSLNSVTVVQSGDTFGQIAFAGANGGGENTGAVIAAQVDGTPGTNDMPGRLVFSTTADGASSPTERMRIDSQGDVVFQGAPIIKSPDGSLWAIGVDNSGNLSTYPAV